LRIGDVLKAHGYIDDAAINDALEFQRTNRELRLGEILIKLGHISEDVLLDFLARLLGLQIIDLKSFHVDPDAVGAIPRAIAEKYTILPISRSETDIILAVNDPLNFHALEEVRTFVPENIKLALSKKDDLRQTIEQQYSDLLARGAAREATNIQTAEREMDFDLLGDDEETPVVRLVNSLLMKGYSVGATDLHIEPFENEILVRIRLDGIISEYLSLDFNVYNSLITRLKIVSGLDIAEKRIPQDGNFRYRIGGVSFNIRTSVIPTVFGEKAVLRFLDMKSQIDFADQFGMNDRNYEKVMKILRNPHGIIYISGATGSGKTTTLYAFLEYLSKKSVSIVSVEDPVERKVRRVAQMQINPAAGLTFHAGLRAILRQDPDIIMVGETRDEETAHISVRAAITGHLVLSTIHTNSAVSTIARLVDMGIPPYMVSSSVVGLLAQRLVRKICSLCKKEYAPEESERRLLGTGVTTLYKGIGCKDCSHTGFKGRIGVHEIIDVDAKMRHMITERAEIDDIENYCVKEKGMTLINQEIQSLVLSGVTTISELVRVAVTND